MGNMENMSGKSIRKLGFMRDEMPAYSDIHKALKRAKWEKRRGI